MRVGKRSAAPSGVPALFARAAVVLADAAEIGQGQRVLDVGCGTGVVARAAARRVGPEGRVVGLDINPRMLAVARRVAPEIEWHHGDAGDLPFEDGAFDVVVSQFAAMFFPDPALAVREMWRVLAPRGRLAIAVCGPLPDAAGYRALAEVAEHVCSPEVQALLRSPFALGDKQRLAGLIADAGIAGVSIDTRACPVRFPSIDALVHTRGAGVADPRRDRRPKLRGSARGRTTQACGLHEQRWRGQLRHLGAHRDRPESLSCAPMMAPSSSP